MTVASARHTLHPILYNRVRELVDEGHFQNPCGQRDLDAQGDWTHQAVGVSALIGRSSSRSQGRRNSRGPPFDVHPIAVIAIRPATEPKKEVACRRPVRPFNRSGEVSMVTEIDWALDLGDGRWDFPASSRYPGQPFAEEAGRLPDGTNAEEPDRAR